MPAAATSIATWPPSGRSGAGRSCTCSTSGGPCLVITTARIHGEPTPRDPWAGSQMHGRVWSERHGTTVDEAVASDDLVHHLLRHPPIARDGHRGQRSVVLRGAVGLSAHGRRDDV